MNPGQSNDEDLHLESKVFPWNTREITAKAEQRDLDAIQEAITQWKAGDEGLPVDEAMAEIRAKHKTQPGTKD